MVALFLGAVNAQAQDSTAKKNTPAETKPAAPAPPALPSFPAPSAVTKKPATSEAKEVAVIKTSFGEMVVEFWPDVAPKNVENFKSLAKKKYFDGTAFHRVINGFMIQGGDPYTKDESKSELWGTGNPGYTVEPEFSNRPHVRGVLSMAHPPRQDAAGSQFFICLGPTPQLDGKYTAFGKLIKGDDVLAKIGMVQVGPGNRGDAQFSRPVTRAGIESIKIVGIDTIK